MVDPSLAVDGGFGFLTDLIGIQMRNMEAIQQAQQKMLEGMSVLAKRQTEIIEGTLRRSVSEPAPATSQTAGRSSAVRSNRSRRRSSKVRRTRTSFRRRRRAAAPK